MSKKNEVKWSADKIKGLLLEKYIDSKWSCFVELRDSTGHVDTPRYFDFFAINTYASQHVKVAYEIKTVRGDFLHELKHPEKRVSAMKFSNEFYFIAQKGIIKEDEVPEGCGYMIATDSTVKRIKAASHRECEVPDNLFLCSLLRAADKTKLTFSKVFKYAGKELNERDLVTLLEQKRTYIESVEVEKKVSDRVEDALVEFSMRAKKIKEDQYLVDIGKMLIEEFGFDQVKNVYDARSRLKEIRDCNSINNITDAIDNLESVKDILLAMRCYDTH